MYILYMFTCICCIFEWTMSEITLTKIVIRTPRPHDIGLIFDVTVCNQEVDKKELYTYQIRGDGGCVTNLTRNGTEVMKDAGQLFGADFGCIEPGESQTVSLIWPTLSLYNRVGHCPIVVSFEDSKEQKCRFRLNVYFDTRFEILDPDCQGLRREKFYQDCMNWDRDYLKDCRPVRCEERYFGKRSYFNKKTDRCEKVPICDKPHMMYDPFANECVDLDRGITEEDIQILKDGKYEKEMLELEPNCPSQYWEDDWSDSVPEHEKVADFCKVNLKRTTFLDGSTATLDDNNRYVVVDQNNTGPQDWVKGITEGLFIVLATFAIYAIICFLIFLVCSIFGRNQTCINCNDTYTVYGGAGQSEASTFTPTIILSQR